MVTPERCESSAGKQLILEIGTHFTVEPALTSNCAMLNSVITFLWSKYRALCMARYSGIARGASVIPALARDILVVFLTCLDDAIGATANA